MKRRMSFLPMVVLLCGTAICFTPNLSNSQPAHPAIGYDLITNPGDPNFYGVIPPAGVGDNLYDLYLFNGTEYYFKAQLTGDVPYIFDPGGVNRFRLLGIEPSAGIDPQRTDAFILLVAFVQEGDFTWTKHPIIQTPFTDIPIGFWADDATVEIYDKGITTGCAPNPLRYCPTDKVTREQMAAFITRAINQVPAEVYCGTTNPFTDVAYNRWSCRNIKRLAELGITTGYGDGRFGPDDFVTREQMAVFLTRAMNMVPPDGDCGLTGPFTDVTFDRWSCRNIKRLAELGITTGYGDERFGPDDYVTRDQMAVFLSRTLATLKKQNECSATGMCGIEGGELKVTNLSSCAYGARIVIPPGALDVVGDEKRSLTIVDDPDYGPAPSLPPGFIGYPRQVDPCGFALDTGGDLPYNVGLEFYFPVQGMTIQPGEKAFAFAYDERLGKWTLVLPESIDGSTMVVKSNYRRLWKWGKIAINDVSEDYLIPVIEDKYGSGIWSTILSGVNQFIDNLKGQQLPTTCASAMNLRDGFLQSWKQSFGVRLEAYQPRLDTCIVCNRFTGDCGNACKVLSEQFSKDVFTYVGNKIEIQMWELLMDVTDDGPAKLYCLYKWMVLWDEIFKLGCNYKCVTEVGGIDFWIDYANYSLAIFAKQVINLAIEQGWVTCP